MLRRPIAFSEDKFQVILPRRIAQQPQPNDPVSLSNYQKESILFAEGVVEFLKPECSHGLRSYRQSARCKRISTAFEALFLHHNNTPPDVFDSLIAPVEATLIVYRRTAPLLEPALWTCISQPIVSMAATSCGCSFRSKDVMDSQLGRHRTEFTFSGLNEDVVTAACITKHILQYSDDDSILRSSPISLLTPSLTVGSIFRDVLNKMASIDDAKFLRAIDILRRRHEFSSTLVDSPPASDRSHPQPPIITTLNPPAITLSRLSPPPRTNPQPEPTPLPPALVPVSSLSASNPSPRITSSLPSTSSSTGSVPLILNNAEFAQFGLKAYLTGQPRDEHGDIIKRLPPVVLGDVNEGLQSINIEDVEELPDVAYKTKTSDGYVLARVGGGSAASDKSDPLRPFSADLQSQAFPGSIASIALVLSAFEVSYRAVWTLYCYSPKWVELLHQSKEVRRLCRRVGGGIVLRLTADTAASAREGILAANAYHLAENIREGVGDREPGHAFISFSITKINGPGTLHAKSFLAQLADSEGHIARLGSGDGGKYSLALVKRQDDDTLTGASVEDFVTIVAPTESIVIQDLLDTHDAQFTALQSTGRILLNTIDVLSHSTTEARSIDNTAAEYTKRVRGQNSDRKIRPSAGQDFGQARAITTLPISSRLAYPPDYSTVVSTSRKEVSKKRKRETQPEVGVKRLKVVDTSQSVRVARPQEWSDGMGVVLCLNCRKWGFPVKPWSKNGNHSAAWHQGDLSLGCAQELRINLDAAFAPCADEQAANVAVARLDLMSAVFKTPADTQSVTSHPPAPRFFYSLRMAWYSQLSASLLGWDAIRTSLSQWLTRPEVLEFRESGEYRYLAQRAIETNSALLYPFITRESTAAFTSGDRRPNGTSRLPSTLVSGRLHLLGDAHFVWDSALQEETPLVEGAGSNALTASTSAMVVESDEFDMQVSDIIPTAAESDGEDDGTRIEQVSATAAEFILSDYEDEAEEDDAEEDEEEADDEAIAAQCDGDFESEFDESGV